MKGLVLTLGAVVPRPPLGLMPLPARSGVCSGPSPVAFRKSLRNPGTVFNAACFCDGPLALHPFQEHAHFMIRLRHGEMGSMGDG